MLEVTIKKGQPATIHVSGTTAEIANEVLNIVAAIYAQLRQQNTAESIIFWTYIMTALNDPYSQAWDGILPHGSIAMGYSKKAEREDGQK